ncbi:unnamed protein product [Leuciscus chuanchicus]
MTTEVPIIKPVPIIGEWSKEAPVTDEMENICIEVAKQAGVHFDVFIPKTYMVRMRCGVTNYLVKVQSVFPAHHYDGETPNTYSLRTALLSRQFTLITITMTTESAKLGGWSKEAPVTEEVEKICIEAEKQAGVKFDVFIPKTFKHQTVAGTNYMVKVKVGLATYLHAMLFQALPCNGGKLTVKGVQYPKTNKDHLVPF